MLEVLIHSAVVSFFSVASAFAAWFLYFCLGDPQEGHATRGRIFSGLGRKILEKFYDREDEIKKNQGQGFNWWKAKGACPPCTNAWLTFIQYPFVAWYAFDFEAFPSFMFFVPFVVLSNGILRKLI